MAKTRKHPAQTREKPRKIDTGNPLDGEVLLTGDLVEDEESPFYWANWAPSHAEIATTFEVSLDTVKSWSRQGMPGKTKNGYYLPRIRRWRVRRGNDAAELIQLGLQMLDRLDAEDNPQ